MARSGLIMNLFLDSLGLSFPLIPLQDPYDWMKRKEAKFSKQTYSETIYRLRRRGFLKVIEKNDNRFIEVTKKGQLETLLYKASLGRIVVWDGKWRILVFDIPESSREKRDQFRWLLKRNNFVKLQASVFVSPYALNKAAIRYLQESGLMEFIRIMRVDKMDNDSDLRNKFNLK
jgi:phenylacetic acid degradation operon negative regulatory protein